MTDTGWLDKIYGEYDNWKGWEAQSDQERVLARRLFEIELRRAEVTPPARILEIGFGNGDFLIFMKEQGFHCDGIERREVHNVRLQALGINATNAPLADVLERQYEAVFAFDVLEHMTKPELLDAMVQIARILKPGGHLLARFPNGASPFGRLSHNGDLTHLLALTPTSFAQACGVGGLVHDGSWNAAYVWTGQGVMKRLIKPIVVAVRRVSEAFLGYVHFGTRIPLDPQVTVRATKPTA
jgi:2-polyprenyl-3-methyl-5-hydroxy-6-metoxy-1,4-benzoquinol methylase